MDILAENNPHQPLFRPTITQVSNNLQIVVNHNNHINITHTIRKPHCHSEKCGTADATISK